jgi:3-deoxy-D-manno-octulosonate 8-phosphate phosphatase (KDO 8-P phosphatase)
MIAFMGDDLPDIPIMKQVGFAIAVSDAHQEVLKIANMITHANGGKGAVREVCEAILHARGLWEKVTERFVGEA